MAFFLKTRRRTFLSYGSLRWRVTLVVVLTTAATAGALEHNRPAGQPHKLAGTRIVFTTWYFVRPGQPDWIDDEGQSLYASKTEHDPVSLRYRYKDSPRGIRLRLETAQRQGPVIRRERPWEEKGIAPLTLMRDEGKYRLWTFCRGASDDRFACYFESSDGLNWARPRIGEVVFEGSKENNLLPYRPGSVFKDPIAPAAERYKSVRHGKVDPKQFEVYSKDHRWSVAATEMDPGKVHAILGAVSADGIHWTERPEPLSIEPSDTQVVGYYDPGLEKYVMYTRSYMVGPRAPGFPPPSPLMYQLLSRRAIGRTESSHFGDFFPAQTILEPGPDMSPAEQIYSNCRTTIPGAPDHHVFFPAFFHLDSDTTTIQLYASHDGRLLHKVPGPYVLDTADYGQWDGGCIFTHPNLVELPNGDWVLPYTGYTNPHKYPHGGETFNVGLAIWPRGRMVAIESVDIGGFTTPAFLAPATRLRINAVTKRVGSIQIEVADLQGNPIPGRSFEDNEPITGDRFWTPVRWNSNETIGVRKEEPVVLRFRMNKARIYGLEFE